MDQEAFRALLAAPRTTGGQSTSGGASASRVFGATPRRSAGAQAASTDESSLKHLAFKPRKSKHESKVAEVKGKSKADDGSYRDRAAERRAGRDGDFADVEKLLEDFNNARSTGRDQVSQEVLDQERAYLGGDANHSILVKGLDMALLERRRAELANGGGLGQVTDDDLEAALGGSRADDDEEAADKVAPPQAQRKRTRDEMVAELKAKRSGAAPAVREDIKMSDELKVSGKFKPINAPRGKSAADKEEEERRERKRKRKEEKKAKKAEQAAKKARIEQEKADHIVSAQPASAFANPAQGSGSAQITVPREPARASKGLPIDATITAPEVSRPAVAQMMEEDGEDDVDIFADAGDYKGLGDSSGSDEDAEPTAPVSIDSEAAQARNLANGRRTWFDNDEDESDQPASEDAPTEVAAQTAKEPAVSSGHSRSRSQSPSEATDAAGPSTRLAGLSGSSDIQTLLALDAEAERAEKKAARKLKGKAAKEGRELSEGQKTNRDWQHLQKFEKRKEKEQ